MRAIRPAARLGTGAVLAERDPPERGADRAPRPRCQRFRSAATSSSFVMSERPSIPTFRAWA